MKRPGWIVLLLFCSPALGKTKKPHGYVLDASALAAIHSYCIDTHNLPPSAVKAIDQFIVIEGKPKGLLSKLPWRRVGTCEDPSLDAIVRVEFPYNRPPTALNNHDIKAVLHVFRKGSPSPVYETQALPMAGAYSDFLNPGIPLADFERNAMDSVIRILVHDLQQQ